MTDAIVSTKDLKELLVQAGDALSNRNFEGLAANYGEMAVWADRLESVLKMVKNALKTETLMRGQQVTQAGSREIQYGKYRVQVRPSNSVDAIDNGKLLAKLMARGIDPSRAMDATVSWKVNKEKVASLVDKGDLTEQDVVDCREERRWALQPISEVSDE